MLDSKIKEELNNLSVEDKKKIIRLLSYLLTTKEKKKMLNIVLTVIQVNLLGLNVKTKLKDINVFVVKHFAKKKYQTLINNHY